MDRLRIFAGSSCPAFAQAICDQLQVALSPSRVQQYGNGCFEVVLGENVRNCSVFIIQTSLPDPHLLHYQLWELLEMVNAARKSSAREVSVVMPHFSYARSDRKWTSRMPITVQLIATFLEAAGMDRFVGMEFHTPQIQSAFGSRIVVDHLETLPLFVEHLRRTTLTPADCIILPGDEGYHKRAERLGEILRIEVGSVEKTRLDSTRVSIGAIHGRVKDKTVVVYDDEILTGGTIAEQARRLAEEGARDVLVLATHALLTGNAIENLRQPNIRQIIVTDSVPISGAAQQQLPLTVLSVANLFADAIREIHHGGSVSRLFQIPEA